MGLEHDLNGIGDYVAAGKEYFMPSVPWAMPSQTPMVLNSKGTPAALPYPFLGLPPLPAGHATRHYFVEGAGPRR
ncbi:MAG: hypothetical protein MZV63_03495 [Marinilabiliales bacterium]|nr:hypothetical protein [Marinilabiliales bacterium]